ncbi:MAG TPA: 50S ribosomal protein L19 [Alphaproteobacteria bacterium]|jgi:large subunit ribosomal protein L19|nr:50S ribosomal protein L19 [Alphaproteobacteria bacterium]|tara:strand:- start:3401 stop:4003 length:603 start_codon:yes stop_codon:yes gene_type:complete
MKIIEEIEKQQIKDLTEKRKIPDFSSGDTIKVHMQVTEGSRERIQIFEGACIAKKNAGINSSFTIRKISFGEGVERVFPLFSPKIEKITISAKGSVRRAKLYYLRERSGKSARITQENIITKDLKEKVALPQETTGDDAKTKTTSEVKEKAENKVNKKPQQGSKPKTEEESKAGIKEKIIDKKNESNIGENKEIQEDQKK